MLANLDAILKHVKKERSEAAQGGLFGAVAQDDIKLVELPDWDHDTKLYYERHALGCFVSGHPILKVRERYAKSATHTCRERDDMLAADRRTRVVVAGLLSKAEWSASGRVLFLSIEDQTGRLELVCFKDEADRFAHCLNLNALVAVKLRARHEETRSSLQVIEAFRLGQFQPKIATKAGKRK